MANRKLGCLTLFLFVALCASAILNIFLAIALLGRLTTGSVREDPNTARQRQRAQNSPAPAPEATP